ncbi:ATP-binding protein [Candidatus Poriferisodalis sp.]|uniref:ATP-binding protein n=1 Tax=Candidatus Poriferisodalis sp. TaxID=3101277 RepID=UPI003B0291A7
MSDLPVPKPELLFDRDREWADITEFVAAPGRSLRLGIVYGRRRTGKSFLLRRVVDEFGGLYHLSLREGRPMALERFGDAVGALGDPARPLPVRDDDWRSALETALHEVARRARGPSVVVLDEYPFLRDGSPELDSAVQSLVDAAALEGLGSGWDWPVSLIVCGSALSVMTELLSGAAPLRGRARLNMALMPFDYRVARRFWGVSDESAALLLDAVVGGVPGHRDLVEGIDVPASVDDFGGWMASSVLNPSHALYSEAEAALREDPRVTGTAVYYSLLHAIAAGRRTTGQIAEAVGRSAGDITYHLGVMTSAGLVERAADVLGGRRAVYRVADPVVRFHLAVSRRFRAQLEERRPAQVWAACQEAFRSHVVGPHFEELCRVWARRYATAAEVGVELGSVGRHLANDARRRESFEIDVVVCAPGEGEASGPRARRTVHAIGEAKLSRLSPADLDRLDRVAMLIEANGRARLAPHAKRLLFSAAGFEPALHTAAASRDDVELIDFRRLYNSS